MSIDNASLNLGTCARNATESARPDLWPMHAMIPALGVQGSRVADLVGGRDGTVNFSMGSWTSAGLGCATSTSNEYVATAAAAWPTRGTFLVDFLTTGSGDGPFYRAGFGSWIDDVNDLLWLGGGSTSVPLLQIKVGGSAMNIVGADPFVAGQRYHMAGTYSTAGTGLWLNGESLGTGAGVSIPALSQVHLGKANLGFFRGFNGTIYASALYDRVLSAAQIRELSADPLLPFRRRAVRSWFLPTGPTFNPAWARTTHTVQAGVST